jgi:REP element-mobilizing transposase RayT
MASFGKYTGRQINTLNGWAGSFWQHYYYDRRIRSDAELQNQIAYVRGNPVKRGYVKQFEDWPYGWCSEGAHREITATSTPPFPNRSSWGHS